MGCGGPPPRRASRLRCSKDFQRIQRSGIRRMSPHFIAIVEKQWGEVEGVGPVLGVTVSRKVGNAVQRNRVKRRIREWFRQNCTTFPPTAAVVVIARAGAAELRAAETESELGGLLL